MVTWSFESFTHEDELSVHKSVRTFRINEGIKR